VKIPKRVNNALDWAEDHIRVITVVTALVVVSAAALWMPALAAFVLGVLVGGVAVRWGTSRRLARLRAEADDLLRENGALRHEKTVLSRGVIASSGQLTQKLPIIPRAGVGPENMDSEQVGSEQDGGDFPRTEALPIIPWADEASDDDNEDTPLMGVIRRRR
jgi:hypothetical protein